MSASVLVCGAVFDGVSDEIDGPAEILVRDGLISFAIAVAAVGSGTFSPLESVGKFAFEVVVGTGIGLAVAWLAIRLRRRLDAEAELALTLLTPFIAGRLPGWCSVGARCAAALRSRWRSRSRCRQAARRSPGVRS